MTVCSGNARALFERINPYPGRALAHHNQRIGTFAQVLGQRRGVSLDEDLLWACAWLHDLGLLVPDRAEPLYLRRSWTVVEPHLAGWGVDAERAERLRVMLRFTHSLAPVPGLDPMADLIRRAVQVEHSHGLVHHGLPRDMVRRTFEAYPRLDLTRILVDFARITLAEDGAVQLLDIFLPQGEG